MTQVSDVPSQNDSTAALWVIKITQRELTPEEEQAFQDWVNDSPENLAAYYHARKIWALTAPQKALIQTEPHTTLKPSRRYRWLSFAAAILLCVLTASIWQGILMDIPDYQAKIGEIKHVTLPDGSQVDLDSGARLTVAFDPQYRQVNLLQGRAYFTAAPVTQYEQRPFRVIAAEGVIQALGTEFVVDHQGENVDVDVYQHSVKVSLISGQEQIVSAGEQVQYEQEISAISPISPVNVPAWRNGQIVFHQQTLPELIDVINHYREKQVILWGEIDDKRISGVFQIEEIDSALANLVHIRGLTLYEMPFFTVIY